MTEGQTKKQIEDQQDERFKKLITEAFAIQAASQPYRPGDRADQEELERFRKEKEAQTSKEQQDELIKKAVAKALAAQQPQQGGGSSNGSQRKSRPYQARNARPMCRFEPCRDRNCIFDHKPGMFAPTRHVGSTPADRRAVNRLTLRISSSLPPERGTTPSKDKGVDP